MHCRVTDVSARPTRLSRDRCRCSLRLPNLHLQEVLAQHAHRYGQPPSLLIFIIGDSKDENGRYIKPEVGAGIEPVTVLQMSTPLLCSSFRHKGDIVAVMEEAS